MALRMLVLSLTGDCNLACRYCYASGQDRRTMSWETARHAIDLAADSKEPFIIQFSGGEPLLALPLLRKIVGYVHTNGIRARMDLQTNGTLITDEVADFLCKSGVGVGVSLDGRPDVHDALRCRPDGGGSSVAVIEGIHRLAHRKMEIGITCVVSAENVSVLTGIIEMSYYLGNVRKIGFDLLRGQGRGSTVGVANETDIMRAMKEVFALRSKLEQLTGQHIIISQERQAHCLANRMDGGFSHCHAMNGEGIHVDAGGNIYACSSFVGDERFFLGTVERGVDESLQREVADMMQLSMKACLSCSDLLACGGGCYARFADYMRLDAYKGECALKRAAMEKIRDYHR